MTLKLWFLAIFGLTVCLSVFALIIWDVWQVMTGGTTLSGYLHALGDNPVVPALIGLAIGVIVGIIIGHLWWPRLEEGIKFLSHLAKKP